MNNRKLNIELVRIHIKEAVCISSAKRTVLFFFGKIVFLAYRNLEKTYANRKYRYLLEKANEIYLIPISNIKKNK
ncbi:hypothetical protein [Bacillus chungangensis]|uniref:Uncharacterized protein n=1 Tax=Bacillus chungangensis TaxID=587633 RepID=A0ABT9WUG5_9BACI|nr:hypothetical protein [Bacillus chungangensis]MDQ0176935.1 hypothetical protein [Bacillus chungangensis]